MYYLLFSNHLVDIDKLLDDVGGKVLTNEDFDGVFF